MAKKIAAKRSDKDDKKLFAFLGVFLTVIGYIIAVLTRKHDRYVMHYAKQGLVLFIAFVIVSVINWIISWIPVIGSIVHWVLNALLLALWVIGMIYSLSGEEKEIPVIGEFARKI